MIDALKVVFDGKVTELDGFIHNPLGFQELDAAFKNNGTFQITIPSAMARESGSIGAYKAKDIAIKCRLEHGMTSVHLVEGGWFPSHIGNDRNTVILPDRNIVSAINGINFEFPKPQDRPLIELLNSDPIFNTITYAAEGNKKRFPNLSEFHNQINEARNKIRSSNPKARILRHSTSHEEAIYSDLASMISSEDRKIKFLQSVSKEVSNQTKFSNMPKVFSEVVCKALDHNLDPRSIIVISVLSAVSVTNGPSVARNMLKCKAGYTDKDAYNAVADFRLMDFSAYAMTLKDGVYKNKIMTMDKNLALLWSGLRLRFKGNSISAEPCEDLFPSEEAREMLHIIETTDYGDFSSPSL